jgi:parvulin-like peptidyl-prolyl isomerase
MRWYQGTFGKEFSDALTRIVKPDWQGPLQSAYGLHWVRVSDRTGEELRPLEDVRDDIEARLISDRRKKAVDDAIDRWMEDYDVVHLR